MQDAYVCVARDRSGYIAEGLDVQVVQGASCARGDAAFTDSVSAAVTGNRCWHSGTLSATALSPPRVARRDQESTTRKTAIGSDLSFGFSEPTAAKHAATGGDIVQSSKRVGQPQRWTMASRSSSSSISQSGSVVRLRQLQVKR